jgi:hypothetical protein
MAAADPQHPLVLAANALTAASLATAYLAEIDMILRIVLTLVGITSGTYAIIYYRRRLAALESDDERSG